MTREARLSVDIGGTFTDLVLLCDDGINFALKVSSTPDRPEDAMLTGLQAILRLARIEPSDLTEVLHGTTVGSNTLLQKVGARAGLITTKGFRDILEIGRLRTPGMFDLRWDKPEPLIARRYRREIDERTAADGKLLRAVNPGEVISAGSFLTSEGVESVAICLLNSYRNPHNERRATEIFREAFPDIPVIASVDVLPEMGEYERTSTTAVNAYVLPSLRAYLTRLEDGLRAFGIDAPLLIGNSNGGLSAAAVAQNKPVFFISSGRASGAVGAARLGAALGERNLVAFDMGGTTASAALVHDGVLSRTHEYEFRAGMSVPSRFIKAGGYLMRVPSVDVAEVGAGAGSIAAIDLAGLVTVGPLSAGANPGPVCYGLGGDRPTVTDANVVLGLLPQKLAGGSLALDVDAARLAIATVLGDPLGFSVEIAAQGIRDVVNTNMVRAISAVTVERGLDPRDLTLMAYGGSGPVHACDLARQIGISRVLFPPSPGVFTAMGMLAANVEHHEIRSCLSALSDLTATTVEELASSMRKAAIASLERQGYRASEITVTHEIDLRLQGQDAALSIGINGNFNRELLHRDFIVAYRNTYGYAPTDCVEAVSLRLQAHGHAAKALDFLKLHDAEKAEESGRTERQVYFNGDWRRTPVISRARFSGSMQGPVIIESADTTIVVPPGASIAANVTRTLVAMIEGSPA